MRGKGVAVLAVVAVAMGASAVEPPARAGTTIAAEKRAAEPIEQRVTRLLEQMTLAEKVTLLRGIWAPDGEHQVGYVAGIPRLGIPPLRLTDGPIGVRDGQPATALPSGVSLAASFDTKLAYDYGEVLGRETKARGYQVLYGPMVNLVRVPQAGRNFETYGEDPHLAGELAAANVKGIQSQGVAAQVKHIAANNQEHRRMDSTSDIDRRTLHEIYLPAFESAVRDGGVWSAMCAYNQVNKSWACENFPLLHDVLQDQWGWDGVVGSDYPATHSTALTALSGMTQEFGGSTYYADLEAAVTRGDVPIAVVDDLARRVLRLEFRVGLFDGGTPPPADPAAGAAFARKAAAEGTVLLKNDADILPLRDVGTAAVIGPYGNAAHPGGGGSSDVTPYEQYLSSPVDGLKARGIATTYTKGDDIPKAVEAAKAADVAVVVVGNEDAESVDRPNIDLGGNQNELVEAVAAANPKTVVVLNTGGPVTMPWLPKVHALVEAWYPGEQDGTALADVLFGDVNPSARLPVTFPTSLSATPIRTAEQYPGVGGVYTYSEGLRVGYRWYDATSTEPLFPFGHGLSYTTFAYANLRASAGKVEFDLTNTGDRAGAEVPQVYVGYPSGAGEPPRQLRGFTKVALEPGQTKHVEIPLEARDFAIWDGAFRVPGGTYSIAVGASSRDLRLNGSVDVPARTFRNGATGEIRGLGKCVDIAGADDADGTPVGLQGCNGTPAQRWNLSSDGTIRALGKCLDATGGQAQLAACKGTDGQQWTAELKNPASGQCLDGSDSGRLKLAACPATTWATPRPSGEITGIDRKCVDVAAAGTANGTAVQLYTCNDTGAQDWTPAPDGTIRALGKCLDVTNGGTANGTKVQLYECNGSAAQLWRSSDGTLVNNGSQRCLDVEGGGSANGTRLQIWDCHADANQRWNLPQR